MNPSKTTARTAGLLYLVLALTGGFSMLYVPSLIVPGDVAATANNLAAHESLFRLGIVSGLICQVVFVFLALALYQLFRGVNQTHASVMVALVVAAVPVAFVNMLNQLAALRILTGADYLAVFERDQLNALMMLFLDLHSQGLLIVEIFWGLWLVPLGLLVMKSRFMPGFLRRAVDHQLLWLLRRFSHAPSVPQLHRDSVSHCRGFKIRGIGDDPLACDQGCKEPTSSSRD